MQLHTSLAQCLTLAVCAAAQPASTPLHYSKTIALPDVQGRIDHMSIDARNQRLFVAALGNNTVEVIDLTAAKRIHTITGLKEPQGLLYLPAVDRLFVANAGDGSVRVFHGSTFEQVKTVPFGDDADNIRTDAAGDRVYVGYGSGALGMLDKDGRKVGEIQLDAHPESFQLETQGPRIFVNLPKSRKIAVVDRKSGKIVATWKTGAALNNYAMAFDEQNHRLFIVCRSPARLIVLDSDTGRIVQELATVGDCDDLFYHAAKNRIYAIGGEGAIAVIHQENPNQYRELARIQTAKGARTGYFSAALGHLYVATRKGAEPAAIRVYDLEQ